MPSSKSGALRRVEPQYMMGCATVNTWSMVAVALMCATTCVCSVNVDDVDGNVLATLKAQVTALTERRQEDFRMLEASLAKTLEKNMQLSTLRAEVVALRKEVDELSGSKTGNRQKNEHLTVQWLSTAMAEMRSELQEVAAAYNVSAELQQRQETLAELGLLRGDVASFRKDFDEMQATQQRSEARLSQMHQEIATARTHSQTTASMCSELKGELTTAQTDWSSTLRAIRKSFAFKKLFRHSLVDAATPNDILGGVGVGRLRHQRELRVQMEELGVTEQQLHKEHARLERRVRRLEKMDVAVDLPERVARLEAEERRVGKAVFNASRQTAGLDKIHQSVLELLESVETLETKVDRKVPEMQREISKMEFNMAQATSSVALIREEQENQATTGKATFNAMVALQEKVETNRGHITVVQSQVMQLANVSAGLHVANEQSSSMSSRTSDAAAAAAGFGKNASSGAAHLLRQLGSVQREYEELVGRLPHDCAGVSGPSGVYLLRPDGVGSPLMAYCDQDAGAGGWTLVQRRVDGVEQFNRNWTEYARGFGSPSGEFWLGNDALHRLTGDNCSSLRVDLRDIYGKTWTAEYSEFGVAAAADGYRLHVTGYTGNASDALDYQNRMQFSTVDSDRDISNTHCAANYEGGWWFSHCQHANLNGRYTLGLTWFDGVRNEWIAVAHSEMKVRRRRDCARPGVAT